ncbi:MAG: TonB-dependent receptor [Flavisolibacter sp.]|nr:TonB-dependent receptor [Flavisolibacter sp.]
MLRLLCLFMIIIFFWPSVLGQAGTIKGFVHYNRQPLAKATILLKNTNHKQITDTTGRFVVENIVPGQYTLQVTMVGFEAFYKSISVRKEEEITVELQPFNSTLNEVVVSGTLKPVQRLQSPIAVDVYTPQFFNKNPSPSIFESLQLVNGVRPQINCNVCNTGDIHINGLEGPYTMVTIDGMPIVSSLSSVYGLFGIPNQLIEKVEVVKGPASGLYGSEAIGGLINIITKAPEKAPLFSADIISTTWQEHTADLGFKWKIKEAATSLIGVHYFNYNHPMDKNNDNFTDVTLQHRISIFNKWRFYRRKDRLATVAARYFYEDRWGGDLQWNKQYRGSNSIYGESIYTNRWELIGKYQLPVREKMFLTFSTTAHHQNSYYGATPYLGDQKIAFGQFTWDKALSARHDFLFGLAGRYNYYDDNSTATIDTLSIKNKPEQTFLPGLFVQDEWQVNEKNILLLGLRYDYHKTHGSIFTPRIAHKWSINDRAVLRMNGGTGFRVVNLFTEDHAALTGARVVEVKEKLQPERSYNISINFTRQLGNRSKILNIESAAWYTYFHNQIIADYEADPNKIIYNNLKGHAVSRGVSMNIEFNLLQRLKGNIGGTFQNVAKVEINANGKKEKQRPMLTENWSSTWTISYTMPLPGITLDYTGNIYGPMRLPLLSALDPRKPYSPVWSIQNIKISKWISSKFEIFGGVKNLLNWTPAKNNPFLISRSHDPFDRLVEYDAAGNVMPTAENPYALTFDPSYVFAPNQGIRFFTGVRLKVKD